MYAYNDISAVVVEHATGLTCAMRGDVLPGLLEASESENVGIALDGLKVVLEFDGGNAKIDMLPQKEFLFTLPKEPAKMVDIPFTPALREALATCLLSVGVDALKPEYMGVTFVIDGAGITLWSTDNVTITQYTVPWDASVTQVTDLTVVVPRATCEQMLKLPTDKAYLSLGERYMELRCESTPPVTLISKLLPTSSMNFGQVLANQVGNGLYLFTVPHGFNHVVDRALVLTAKDLQKLCTLSGNESRLDTEVRGGLGELRNAFLLDKPIMPSVIEVDPSLLSRALKYATHCAFGAHNAFILAGGNFTHMIIGTRQG